MPTGLLFGPDFPAGPNRLDLPPKFKKTKAKTKRKVKSRSKGESRSKLQRERKREDKKKRWEEKLQRREERREKRRVEQGETGVRKAKRSVRKQNHCYERVDATIMKVLGRSLKKTAPKSKDKNVNKEVVGGPKWKHGMREEMHEDCPKRGVKTNAAEKKQPVKKVQLVETQPREKQPAERLMVQQPLEQALEEKQPCVDGGPLEQPCSSDEATKLMWPLSNQTLLEPLPPCQVRK